MLTMSAVAARTILAPTISYLEQIADKKNPLRFVLQETDYQPFISLFHALSVVEEFPELAGVRASSLYYSSPSSALFL